MFHPVDHHKTADAVVEQIEGLILRGLLQSGDRLPAERALAERLNVSRPVLRDALRLLEERKLIEARQGGGTFICDLIGPIFSEPIVQLIARHPSAINDYFEFRRGIEGQASAQAAMRAAPSDLERLGDLVEQMKSAHEQQNPDRESKIDVAFHHAIGEAAHNIVLLHTLRSCYRLLENGVFYNRGRLYDMPAARNAILDQHVTLFEAIKSGDPVASRIASEQHIDYVRGTLTEVRNLDQREKLAGLRRLKSAKSE